MAKKKSKAIEWVIEPCKVCGHDRFDHVTEMSGRQSLYTDGRPVILHDGKGPCLIKKCKCAYWKPIPIKKAKAKK